MRPARKDLIDMAVSLRVSVVKRTDRTSQFAREAQDRVAQVLGEGAVIAAAIARQLAPKRTGRLRASIAVEQEGKMRFSLVASAPYAAFVELGTEHQEPQPYLAPAVAAARREIERRLARLRD
ncbi:MAG TPA: HK97-gp10 family putative phage morphogenesis protein [Blastocatellia bacterium]|nr:HK97-gp10 family putative phage morphogenesis protein [Blastocatellia bacterium]